MAIRLKSPKIHEALIRFYHFVILSALTLYVGISLGKYIDDR